MFTPLFINDAEVIDIDVLNKRFDIIVHLYGIVPIQMHTPEVKDHVAKQVNYAVRYMIEEGFIDDPMKHQWWANIAGVVHNQPKN